VVKFVGQYIWVHCVVVCPVCISNVPNGLKLFDNLNEYLVSGSF